ncbi:MAG: iron-containing alcohol dehydrogenase [Synergistaceae bacterium]|nr:iron-containing alcohol dehydrogenase [Synergistaceae bacterium]
MNFNMFLSGRISFGPGVSSQVGLQARKLGASRAVLVTDKTMEDLGLAEKIADHLTDAGVETCLFTGVEAEPSVETTDAVAQLARQQDCQLVVGLGGGSSMDVAKAVSILITNEGSAANYQGLGLVKNPGVPKIMIPTTAGTGSEVTFTAVLIRRSDGVKGGINDDKLFPDYSLLDPELTLSMPPHVTAATGMDALCHALEAYTSRQASPFSDLFAEEALMRIGSWLRVATLNGKDLEARSEMMLAALYGGIALANAGVTACHSLSYPLGGMFGVSHGQANALLIPYVARFNALARPDKFASAAALLGYIEEELPQRDAALLCADALDELSDDLGLPRTLKQLKVGITEAHFDEMADKALAVARPMENNPRVMTKEDCITLYREAME